MKIFFTFLSFIFIVGLSYGQTTIWSEDFSSYTDPSGIDGSTGSATNVGDYPSSVSKWTLDVSSTSIAASTDWFYVTGGEFSARRLNGEAVWTSEIISITTYSNVLLSMDVSESGTMEGTDYIRIYYKLDGGAETLFSVNGNLTDDFTSAKVWQANLNGSTVQIVVRCDNSALDEYHRFDNIKVEERGTSDIIKKSGWSEPTNIPYATYNALNTLTTNNSIEVASFTIRDGGAGTDADNLSTTLTDISFTVDKWENLAALAIFDNTGNISEITSFSSATVVFSGLSLQAADDNTKDFSLRATYKSIVTDNDNLKFSISVASAAVTGSIFAEPNAGGAETDNTVNNNKLIVTADHLAFENNYPPSAVFVNTAFTVSTQALDANGNIDLDETSSVSIVKATGTGVLSSTSGLTANLVGGSYQWSDIKYNTVENFTIEAQSASLTNITSSTIACVNAVRAWINEFHYDNDGTDADEFVEICIENLSSYTQADFSVDLYNGNDGASYNTKSASSYTTGTAYDNISVLYYDYPAGGIQNGAPDGIAISYNGALIEFISYEGTFTATDGPASGITSHDVGVSQNGAPVGTSIQRTDTNDAFQWSSGVANTKGAENTNQILPIELISFTAKYKNKAIELHWQTASETNNDYFTIERSLDAVNFEPIGIIQGAGNSNVLLNYSYVDRLLDANNIIYYRLNQTDYNGDYSYSNILSVQAFNDKFELLKYYYTDGNIYIFINNSTENKLKMELLNVNGQTVVVKEMSMSSEEQKLQLSVGGLSAGIYFLRITSEQNSIVEKIYVSQ